MRLCIARTLAAGAVIALAACGGADGLVFEDRIDDATATAQAYQAQAIADEILDNMTDFEHEGTFPDLTPGMTPATYRQRIAAAVWARGHRRDPKFAGASRPLPVVTYAACVPTETGIDADGYPVDTDGDEVPDDYRVVYPADCIEDLGDISYQLAGSYRIRDLPGSLGYRLEFGNYVIRISDDSTGEFYEFKVSGFDQAVFSASGIAQSSDLAYTTTTSPDADALNIDFWAYKVTSQFYPSLPITFDGASLPPGNLMIDATFRTSHGTPDIPGANYRFALTTLVPLQYVTGGCYDIAAGTLRGELNGDDEIGFELEWAGCDDVDVTTFGTI